jgi:hypothetical protein
MIAVERTCPHRRNGGELIVECRGCEGGQDLSEERCLRSVIDILSNEGEVREIILSGDWEVSYTGDSMIALRSLAEIVRSCSDLSKIPNRFQDCSSCPLAPSSFYCSIARGLPFIPDRERVSTMARMSTKHHNGCKECLERTSSNLDWMRYSLDALGRSVAKMAFRVVDSDEA